MNKLASAGKARTDLIKRGTRKALDFLLQDPAAKRVVIIFLVVIALVAILSSVLIPKKVEITAGQPARADIEAPRDMVNRLATDKLKAEAEKQAVKAASASPVNYDISPAASINAEDTVNAIFERIGKGRTAIRLVTAAAGAGSTGGKVGVSNRDQTQIRQARLIVKEISTDFGVTLPENAVLELLRVDDQAFDEARRAAKSEVGTVMKELRISKENLEMARERVSEAIRKLSLPPDVVPAVIAVAKTQVSPNLVLNPGKVEKVREAAVRAVEPVMILKGQIIVRRGEIATEEDVALLRDLGLLGGHIDYAGLLGIIVLVLVLMSLIGVYLYQYNRKILETPRLLAALGTIVVLVVFIAAVITSIPWPGSGYLVPVTLGTMMIAILLDSRLAIVSGIVFGLLAGIMGGNVLRLALVAITGSVVGVYSVSKVGERSDLMRAGFLVGAANAFAIIGVGPATGSPEVAHLWYLGMVNGLLSTIFAIGLLPFFENMFHITSAIKLLELSNPNQPLLRRLLIEAPGTYHHSIIVGNLAEAAAEMVGGDSLLVRVGSYYHDVGKLKRPYFFVENQLMQDNPHDRISPSLSTLVIISHVKDGVELAGVHRLPEAIIDLIKEHHGTSLVPYFYHKATENDGGENVDESDFRYPGPKPQSKEAAIVMLADSVEAAVRSLARPTPGRIEGLVRKIIKERLNDGQFDECNLTLKELDAVADAFVRVLSGIFHARIEYPDGIAKEVKEKEAKEKEVRGGKRL
ncbi:MAG TPA: HDIG domain-containing protein [Firmicutes bacterium]|nr:HDIG domain-containing protein [Bacillota bacterium]